MRWLKKILRYPYLECVKQKDNKEKEDKNDYLAYYALESDYGYWVSRDCHKDKIKEIFGNKIKLQNDISKDIKYKMSIGKANIINKIKDALKKLSKDLKIKECIEEKNNDIDARVNKKMDRDSKLFLDERFKRQYTTGFAQHKMPIFDENDFENFRINAMESCLIKLNGERKSNLFVKKLQNVIPKENQKDVFKSAKALSNWLEKNWTKYYDQLRYYYKSEKETENKITITHTPQKYETDSGIACIAMLLDGKYDRVKRNAYKIFGSSKLSVEHFFSKKNA